MDIEVRPVGGCVWDIVDLLGRKVGALSERDGCYFVIPLGDRLGTVDAGPFISLDAVCTMLESKVRGQCRVVPTGSP